MVGRRTQAQRRAQSQQSVLEAATQLFGTQGYATTSLDQIAAHAGLTIRPIYHYFGSKLGLFTAVHDAMEAKIVAGMDDADQNDPGAAWRAYLDLCEDAAFRQIVLIDSPNILGRSRWQTSPAMTRATELLAASASQPHSLEAALQRRVILAALTETALFVAEAEDFAAARRAAEKLFKTLSTQLTSAATQ